MARLDGNLSRSGLGVLADPDRHRLSMAVAEVVRHLAQQLRCVDSDDPAQAPPLPWDRGSIE
jgi:hypothetical protein